MIIDEIRCIARYRGLSENFDRAIDALEKGEMDACPTGTTQIDGDRVYVMVMENTYDRTEPKYECHAQYADIQVILTGEEGFALGTGGEDPVMEPGKDVAFCGAASSTGFTLGPGWFVIFFPWEKHAPGLKAGEQAVRKMVVKVRC